VGNHLAVLVEQQGIASSNHEASFLIAPFMFSNQMASFLIASFLDLLCDDALNPLAPQLTDSDLQCPAL
jgi:hypothetical protein